MKHLFIINPIAGGKRAKPNDTKRLIESVADILNINYEIYFTTAPMDACRKVAHDADNSENIRVYACGGDGTLNECVNGAALRQNTAVTHFPHGTGNDFIKTFGRENVDKFRDIKSLVHGSVHKLDLINCSDGRYGINVCSVGIDARVGRDVHKYSKLPLIGGGAAYVISMIANLISGIGQRYHIKGDCIDQDNDITLMCVCNGRYYGGGFNPMPDALPNDGILDILIIKAIPFIRAATIVGKYAKGQYKELDKYITHIRSDYIEVEAEHNFVVNVDGEMLNRKKLSFKLIPAGVNFILPNGVGID